MIVSNTMRLHYILIIIYIVKKTEAYGKQKKNNKQIG
jgi:hypothetical protein